MTKILKFINIDAPRQCKFLSAQSMTACRFIFTLAIFGCLHTFPTYGNIDCEAMVALETMNVNNAPQEFKNILKQINEKNDKKYNEILTTPFENDFKYTCNNGTPIDCKKGDLPKNIIPEPCHELYVIKYATKKQIEYTSKGLFRENSARDLYAEQKCGGNNTSTSSKTSATTTNTISSAKINRGAQIVLEAERCTKKLLERFCDDEGYKMPNGAPAYGTFNYSQEDQTVTVNCYKIKNQTNLEKSVSNCWHNDNPIYKKLTITINRINRPASHTKETNDQKESQKSAKSEKKSDTTCVIKITSASPGKTLNDLSVCESNNPDKCATITSANNIYTATIKNSSKSKNNLLAVKISATDHETQNSTLSCSGSNITKLQYKPSTSGNSAARSTTSNQQKNNTSKTSEKTSEKTSKSNEFDYNFSLNVPNGTNCKYKINNKVIKNSFDSIPKNTIKDVKNGDKITISCDNYEDKTITVTETTGVNQIELTETLSSRKKKCESWQNTIWNAKNESCDCRDGFESKNGKCEIKKATLPQSKSNNEPQNTKQTSSQETKTDETVITITGSVSDSAGPLPGASVCVNDAQPKQCTVSDSDGKFKLTKVKSSSKIKITYIDYQDQILDAKEIMSITLLEKPEDQNPNALGEGNEVSVSACQIKKDLGWATAEAIEGTCYPTKCIDGYNLEGTEKEAKCVKSEECTVENGKATLVDGECTLYECDKGFKADDEGKKCIPNEENTGETESEPEPEETKTEPEPEETKPEKEKTTDSGLTEEESQAKIEELQAESDAAHEKENSTANKLLGAAGIGATGIGAMQMMSGMAEQNADEDAENQMKAYMATFRCNYGGLSHKGGETAIELPTSTEIITLKQEYITLVADIKARKEGLGMPAGIESELILDAATTGLYDDVHTGKTTSMYTSVYTALSDENSEDAKKWQEQKDAAAKKKKTGMITAAVGAAGSLVGNLIVNRDKKDKKTNDKSLNKLHDDIGTLPPQTANCPSNTTGTYPDCQCHDTKSIFNPNTLKCDLCKGDKVAIDGTCQCPTGTIVRENDKCETPTNGEDTNTCTLTGDNVAFKSGQSKCECINGFVQENNQCVCKDPMQINSNGICITVSTNTTVTTKTEIITLSNDQLFAIGSYTLVDGAKNALKSFLNDLSENGKTNCKIDIKGYADPVGSENGNLTLSKNRANAIKDYLEKNNSNNVINTITAVGMGENYCTCGVGTLPISDELKDKPDYKNCVGKDASYQISGNQRYAPCRRVEISANCEQTETTIKSATGIDITSVASGLMQNDTDAD